MMKQRFICIKSFDFFYKGRKYTFQKNETYIISVAYILFEKDEIHDVYTSGSMRMWHGMASTVTIYRNFIVESDLDLIDSAYNMIFQDYKNTITDKQASYIRDCMFRRSVFKK